MNPRRLLTALVMALAISGLLTLWLSTKMNKPHTVQAAAPHRYVGASQNLDPGSVIQPSDVKLVDWPSQSPVDGASDKMADIVGRTVLYPIAAGEPVLSRQVSLPGAGFGLSARIPNGMRAISLRDDEIVGVAGFLLPGTHVDVLMTYRSPAGDSITTTVLQDAQVLTAGQKTTADPDGKAAQSSVVTLLVTPDDAEKLTLASAQGSIHFVLRNGADHQQNSQRSEDLATVSGMPEHVAVASVSHPVVRMEARGPAKPYIVQTISGDKQTAETFK